MTNNIKFMLLGIFLAVMSAVGFILADEVEVSYIVAIALTIAAVCTFLKGFTESDKAYISENETKTLKLSAQNQEITNEVKNYELNTRRYL